MQTKIYPPVYLLLSIIIMTGLDRFLPFVTYANSIATYIGGMLIVAGVLLVFLSAYKFKREGTAIKPFADSSTLVTTGLFGFSRNPIYLGMVLVLCGIGLLLGSLSPFIMPIIFFIFIHQRFILREEKHLTEQFGDVYRTYQKKVRRWL